MEKIPEPRVIESEAEIAVAMRRARRRDGTASKAVFLIGAGCSVTAGIPSATKIARSMVQAVAHDLGHFPPDADPIIAYQALIQNKQLDPCPAGDPTAEPTDATIDWFRVYDTMFRQHYKTPDDVRELFEGLVRKANGAINWAHLCLGEIVAQGFASTVLTTNFDQLCLAGMVGAGIMPVVCDGVGSLDRITGAPHHPQLLELHGSRHTYLLRNSEDDVAALGRDSATAAAINKLFQYATVFIAVGYGGRENGVMDLLIREAKTFHGKNLFWVNHAPDPAAISSKVREFLATSRNSGLLVDRDADSFFLSLCQALGVGAPKAIADPLAAFQRIIEQTEASEITDPAIHAEVRRARDRLERLRPYDSKTPVGDPVAAAIAAIQDARLAGNFAEAYRLANEALAQ